MGAVRPEHLSPKTDRTDARALSNHDALELDRKARMDALAQRRLKDCVPIVTLDALAAPLKRCDALEKAIAWERGNLKALMLRGEFGRGKSVAVGAALRAHVRRDPRRCSISWHTSDDFVSSVLEPWRTEAKPLGTTMIVVDDVGFERCAPSDFALALAKFMEYLPGRIALSTNLFEPEFRARYDERTLVRLNANGMAVDVTGPSLRRTGGGF